MSEISRCPFCGGEASVQRCEHAFHDAKIRCAGCQAEGPIFDVDDGEANEAGRNEAEAIAAWNRRTPAPEGEAVAWRCSGCRRLTDDLDADHAALDAGGFLSCCPERDMKPLYASPVVPVGVSEVLDAAAAYLKDTYGASYGLDHPVDRARIIAALRPTDTGWREITAETRNGDDVLAYDDETGDCHVSHWTGDYWYGPNGFKPTHWMPLPPAPTDTGANHD